jgi:hypothetical protein
VKGKRPPAKPSAGEWLSRGDEDRGSHIKTMFRKGGKASKGQKGAADNGRGGQAKGKRRRGADSEDEEDEESDDSFVAKDDSGGEEEQGSGEDSEEDSAEDDEDEDNARAKKKNAKAKPKKKAAAATAKKKKKAEEVIEIGSDDSDSDDSSGAEDEDADADSGRLLGADSDEDKAEVVSKLSKAAQEKLAVCRKISDGLRAALGRWEKAAGGGEGGAATAGEETGCLNLTALASGGGGSGGGASGGDESSGESDDSRSSNEGQKRRALPQAKGSRRNSRQGSRPGSQGEWQPVDAAVIEAQCPGLAAIKPYQCVGVNWLLLLHHQNVAGVLADDMGLGKTVQTIGFFAMLKRNALARHPDRLPPLHLVVVPASVLANWQAELLRFAPHLRVVAYHGEARATLEVEGSGQ